MKEGWEYKKLEEVGRVITGSTPSTKSPENYSSKDVCFVKPSDLPKDGVGLVIDTEFHISKEAYNNSRKLPKGSVLTTCIGIVGKVAILQVDATCNQQINAIIPDATISSHFLAYSILSKRDYLEKRANAPVVPIINKKDFSSTVIAVPPLSEQQHIVEELDLLSSIIEKKKAQLNELDNLAQSLFYEMFSDINAYTPISTYVESVGGGKSLAGNEECENKVLKTGAVTYDHFNGTEVKNLPIDYTPQQEHLVKDGDILVSRMNTLEYVGACAYVWKAPKNTYLPDRLWRVKPKEDINSIFLWFSLIQSESKEQIRTMASGTSGTMKNISRPRFLSVKIKKVPLELQNRFADKIEAIEHQKELIKQSIKEVETLFNSRMDYYFN